MPHTKEHKTYLPEEVLRIYRSQTGIYTDDWNDYENAKVMFAQNIKTGEVSEVNPYFKGEPENYHIEKPPPPIEKVELEEPSYPVLESILSFTPMGAIAEGGLESVLGTFGTSEQRSDVKAGRQPFIGSDSYKEFAQRKYNESMAGQAYAYLYGEPKYDVDEHDEGMVVEAGGTIMGMLNPVDTAVFLGTGLATKGFQAGSAALGATKALQDLAFKGMSKYIPETAMRFGNSTLGKWMGRYIGVEAGIESFLNMSIFGSAQSALHSASQQSQEVKSGIRDEIDYMKVSKDAAKGGFQSGMIAFPAGLVARGIMAPKFAKAKMASDPSFANTITKLTANPAGQVIAEGAIFGTGHYGIETLPKMLNGEINPKTGKPYQWDFSDWGRTMFESTAVVGALRLATKPMRKNQNDVTRFNKKQLEFYEGVFKKKYGEINYTPREGQIGPVTKDKGVPFKKFKVTEKGEFLSEYNSLEKIIKDIADAGMPVPKELYEKLTEMQTLAEGQILGYDALDKRVKDFNSLMNEIKKGNKDLTELPADVQAKILEDLVIITNAQYEMYKTLQTDKNLAYELYKEQISKKDPLDKNSIGEIDKIVETKLSELQDIKQMLNGGGLNNPAALKLQQAKYSDGFTVKTREMKDGKFELILETPTENKILLPDGIKIHNTEKSALDLGKRLAKRYKERTLGEDSKADPKAGLSDEVSIVKVNPQNKQPIVDAQGNVKPTRVSKAEADKMISEGTAVLPKDVNVNPGLDVNSKSLPSDLQKLAADIQTIKQTQQITAPVTAEMPMNKPAYDKIKLRVESILKETLPKDAITKAEETFIKMKNRKGNNPVADNLPNMTEVNKNAFVDFATWHFGNVISKRGMSKIPGQRTTINEMSKFLSDLSKEGKDVSTMTIEDIGRFFDKYKTQAPNTKRADAMTKFTDFITRKKYIDATTGSDLLDYARSKFTETNEYIAQGTAPAKKKLRTKSIELAENTGDMGIEIAAKTGARFYLRPQEVNALAKKVKDAGLKEVLKLDKGTGEYYLDLKVSDGTSKSGTFDRYVYVDKGTANLLIDYINNGGSLTGKMSKVGQLIKNNKEINSGNKSPFYDYRKRVKSAAEKINFEDQSVMDYMLGHNKNRIDGIYKKLSVSEHIKLQKELHKKLGSPIEEINLTKGTGFEVGISLGLPTPQQMRILRKGLVETGKFLYKDLPRYMRRSGDKLGINKDNFVDMYKKIESGAKGISKGVTNWFKGVMNHMGRSLKTAGTSIQKYVKDYIDNPKIGLGIDIVKDPTKIKPSNVKGVTNSIKRDIRLLSKEFNLKPNELIEFVSDKVGIENPAMFESLLNKPPSKRTGNFDIFSNELVKFLGGIENLNIRDYIGKKDILKSMKLVEKIEKQRKFVNFITDRKQKELLKLIGVKDGNLLSASNEKLIEYRDFLRGREPEAKGVDYILAEEINKAVKGTMWENALDAGAITLAPVHVAVKQLGFKKLSEKMLTHIGIEEVNLTGLSNFNRDVIKESGGIIATYLSGTTVRDVKAQNIKNNLWAIEGKGEMLINYLQWAASGEKLPMGDRANIRKGKEFFDKAVNEEWWGTVKDGKGDSLNKKNKDGEYIYINTKTKEGRVVESYLKNIVEFYGESKYKESLMRNLPEAEFQDAQNKVKFINDGIYITRILTQLAKKALNVEGEAKNKAIREMALDIAISRAKGKYGKDLSLSELNKKIREGKDGETLLETSELMASERLRDGLLFNPGKIDIKYFKDRHLIKDVYTRNDKGKLVRTYEWKFDKTVMPYAQGMSKFYATMSVFPDVVRNLKPGNNLNKIFDVADMKLGHDSVKLSTVRKILEKQLGLDNSADMFGFFHRFQSGLARVTVKGKLSFGPITGLNNLFFGGAARNYTYRLRHQALGLLDILSENAKVTARARRAGAFDIGKALYEGTGTVDKIADLSLMKTSLLKPTESFNRIMDVAASKYDQKFQFEILKSYPKDHPRHKRALEALNVKYQLTNKEIQLRNKYSKVEEIIQDVSIKSEYERTQKILRWKSINEKMNVYAHVNVQGSSQSPFMPFLGNIKLTKPWMALMSMAYMNTTRTTALVKHSIKHKSFLRPIVGTSSHIAAGALRMYMYKELYNRSVPDDFRKSPWKWLKNALWYGGFGGLLSDLIPGYSPYDGGGVDEFHPAIYDTFNSSMQETKYVLGGEKSLLKGVGSFAEDNVMLYGQAKKYLERTDNILTKAKLNGDRININKLKMKYKKNFKNSVMPTEEKVKNQRELMYENLREHFYLGNKQEFHDTLIATALELATQIFGEKRGVFPEGMEGKSEQEIDNFILKEAYEESWSRLMTKAKSWNPYSPYSFKKDSAEGQMISSSFFLYSAGIIDSNGENRIDDAEADSIKNWIMKGGRDSKNRIVPAEDIMSGYQLELWNDLHSAEDRYLERLKEYMDLDEIIEYHKKLPGIKDPIWNLEKVSKIKKSIVRTSWEDLFTP